MTTKSSFKQACEDWVDFYEEDPPFAIITSLIVSIFLLGFLSLIVLLFVWFPIFMLVFTFALMVFFAIFAFGIRMIYKIGKME